MVGSTGRIGVPLPIEKMEAAIKELPKPCEATAA